MASGPRDSVVSRLVAVLAADGVDGAQLAAVTAALAGAGAHPELVSPTAIVRLADGTDAAGRPHAAHRRLGDLRRRLRPWRRGQRGGAPGGRRRGRISSPRPTSTARRWAPAARASTCCGAALPAARPVGRRSGSRGRRAACRRPTASSPGAPGTSPGSSRTFIAALARRDRAAALTSPGRVHPRAAKAGGARRSGPAGAAASAELASADPAGPARRDGSEGKLGTGRGQGRLLGEQGAQQHPGLLVESPAVRERRLQLLERAAAEEQLQEAEPRGRCPAGGRRRPRAAPRWAGDCAASRRPPRKRSSTRRRRT